MRRFLRPGFLVPTGGRLWVVDEFQPVAALLDPASGAVERLVGWPELPPPPAAGDSRFEGITDHCWPLPPRPVDADSYVEYERSQFDSLETYWRSPAGTAAPLAAGIHDCSATLHGKWPDTTVRISFSYPPYPGLRLVRVLDLFDELGRPTPPRHAAIHLMEALETNQIPPPGDAVNGELSI